MKKILIVLTVSLLLFQISCSKTTITTPNTDNLTPSSSLSDSDFIRKAVIDYQMQYFDKNEGKIVSCGLNFPYIIDGAPGEKTAYGYSSFAIYDIDDNGNLELKSASGAAPIAVTFSTDGKKSSIDFICLTDDDLKSEKFEKTFPDDAKKWILENKESNYTDTYKNQDEQTRKIYKEITGKEYTLSLD